LLLFLVKRESNTSIDKRNVTWAEFLQTYE
jgi:hypothetical protein